MQGNSSHLLPSFSLVGILHKIQMIWALADDRDIVVVSH